MVERHGIDGVGQSMGGNDLIARDAISREEVALRLTVEAMRQGQRAMVGVLALPASIALGVAAGVSYAAAFLERGFETFELSLARLARDTRTSTEHGVQQRGMFPGSTTDSEQLAKTVRS